MKLTFLGADREVTGSCTQLEAAGHRILIDCGMEQGRDVYENADLPYAPGTYEALLLTHAHIDHSGRIPYLYKNGYRGPIYTTDATRDLCAIMLEDSAHIQEQEAEWKNRKAMRSGAEMVEPDYTVEDAEKVMQQFVPCPYETWQNLFDGPTGKIEMRFTDVGHLLGSASISLRVTEPGKQPEIIVFSGDIGNTHQPLIKDPANPGHADYLIMESTYGDRSHGPKPDYLGELTDVLQSTFDKGGNVVIPSFAVGRTQELLYFLRQIKAEGRVTGLGNFPVYVDSPLATETSRSMWTARWPASPPLSSARISASAMTRKPWLWCRQAGTRCSSPACTSARPKKNPWPSTATPCRRSSSRRRACATRAASATI